MNKLLKINALWLLLLFTACAQSDSKTGENTVSTTPSVSTPNSAATDATAQPQAVPSEPIFLSEGQLDFISPTGKPISKLEIEIVDNDADRAKGLMYRKSMPDYRAMLFVFEQEAPQSFWMKNTIMPLDIIYVNAKMEVVKVCANTTPFSEKPVPSEKPALYVVEVNAGYATRHGITEGVKISFK